MNFFSKLRELTPQRRLIFASGIGIITMFLVLYDPSAPEVVMAPQISPNQSESQEIAKPVMPQGYQPEQSGGTTRDPFALPPGLRQSERSAAPADQPVKADSTVAKDKVKQKARKNSGGPAIRLTGIASSDGVKTAVIRISGKSKAYRINETVGVHRLAAIGDDSAILDGPDGERILRIEAASQRGGGKKHAE